MGLSLGSRPAVHGNSVHDPVFDPDFADPSVLRDVDGQWYAFATEGKQVQAACAPSAAEPWMRLAGHESPPHPGALANGPAHLGPRPGSGPGAPLRRHRKASSALGPYAPADTHFTFDIAAGGAIDTSGFRDGDWRYVVYKVDGNGLGSGGAYGNEGPPTHPTPNMLQELEAADGATPLGAPALILDNDDSFDGPLVEGPSLLRIRAGLYVLFFSSGCFRDAGYRANHAAAADAWVPFMSLIFGA
ncbi:hypothetical protein DL770_009777 [Monosporascus sp. CRB-9-2]|nr:hypothetical protein DL770_009777 [Monosporascus sp. CRB-9-2]